MSKRRTIDSKIRGSQTFASLDYRQRDLWQGLIVVVDDQGRMPGDPRFVRSQVWPYDDTPIEEVLSDLQKLADIGNIIIYQVEESTYIQIINWHYYQRGAEWLGLSEYPAPPDWTDHARYHGKGNKIEVLNWETRQATLNQDSVPSGALPCREGKGNGEGKGNVNVNGEAEVEGNDATQTPVDPAPENLLATTATPTNIQNNWDELKKWGVVENEKTRKIAEDPTVTPEVIQANATRLTEERRFTTGLLITALQCGDHPPPKARLGQPKDPAKYAEWEQ